MKRLTNRQCTVLTNENYFSSEANDAYLSVSQIKSFLACEERAKAELDGKYDPTPKKSMLVGAYVDAYFSRELDLFRSKNPDIFTQNGELRSEYRRAEEIISRIEADKLAMRILAGEKQKIVTGAIGGEPFKAKMDVYLDSGMVDLITSEFPEMEGMLFQEGAIVDLKIVKDFAPIYKDGEGRQNWIEAWGYDLQMSVYQELMRQQTGHTLPCYILAATKETPSDIGLFEVPQPLMDANMQILIEKIPGIVAVKSGSSKPERCEKCDWCRQTRVLNRATWPEEYA